MQVQRGESLVQCFENMRSAYHLRNAMPVHIGAQVAVDAREHDFNIAFLQILAKVSDGPRCRIVEIGDGSGIDYEPAHRGRRMVEERYSWSVLIEKHVVFYRWAAFGEESPCLVK